MPKRHSVHHGKPRSVFDRFAGFTTGLAGSSWAFGAALLCVIVWAAVGPLFSYSESWQMVINTGTTIITFLMVFLIQQSQNKDSAAIHLKLNELLASHELASNRLVDIESLDESDLKTLRAFYEKLAARAAKESGLKASHSLDEAEVWHKRKVQH